MSLEKFVPLSPDPDLNVGADMTLARFGHLNKLVDEINSGGGGGGSAGIIVEGEGLNTSIRCGVNNQAFGNYGMALGGEYNTSCNDYTVSIFGRGNCAVGCYSGASGISNVVCSRNSYILGGNNNTIAYDASQGAFSTQSSYSGNYFCAFFSEAPYPEPQILAVRAANNLDVTAQWNVGDTMSGFYTYLANNTPPGIGPGCYGTAIQFVNAEITCVAYENRTCGGCGTWLYTCFDLNTPAWCGTIAALSPTPTTTRSNGYLQKTGSFSDYATYANSYHANVIAGGAFNTISGNPTSASTISGGYQNTMSGGYGVIAGGYYNYSKDGGNIIGGGYNIAYSGSTIGGGGRNKAYTSYGFIGTGESNVLCSAYGFIGGGYVNTIHANSAKSIIGAGQQNTIHTNSAYTFIMAGNLNTICTNSVYSGILGGRGNIISDTGHAIIGGGQSNTINFSSTYSGILGGAANCISYLGCTFIIGSNITADRSCTTFVNNLSIVNLPTASAGLPSKSLWYDPTTCVVKFVP